MTSTHLFILCPPFSGSTLLWRLIGTSGAVSVLPKEGQFLPEVEAVMRQDPWDRERELPWPRIKCAWDGYWDSRKPVLLEKSPPNLVHAAAIAQHFDPVRFVVMVREPFAHCEGLMRRNGWSVELAAAFSGQCLRQQQHNVERLDHVLRLTYEELARDPRAAADRIERFLPALGRLDAEREFKVHRGDAAGDRVVEAAVEDLNAEKIARLSAAQIAAISAGLAPYEDALQYWGYALR